MQKMIDVNNGNFQLSDKLRIDIQCSFSKIKETFPNNKIWIIGNGYRWIYFNVFIENLEFNIGVCYFGKKIHCIDLRFDNPNDKKNLTWEEWEEEKKNKEKEYKNWLIEQIGEKHSFHWGKIEIYNDPRSDSIGILIKYF